LKFVWPVGRRAILCEPMAGVRGNAARLFDITTD
jgi:hypothetical protein